MCLCIRACVVLTRPCRTPLSCAFCCFCIALLPCGSVLSCRHFQATFFAATAERLDDVSPELLTHLVWSLGRLRFSPSHMWWRSLVCAAAGIEKPFSHAQLASLIHSVALWAEPGGIAAQDVQCFVDLLLVEIDEHLGVLQPAELTTVVWALGSLAAAGKFTADAQLQSDLLSAVQDQLPRLSPLQCSNLCWGLAKLNHHLPDGFAEALLLEVQAQLTGFSNSNLCSVLWALARLELVPLAPFREQLWEELQHRYDLTLSRLHNAACLLFAASMTTVVTVGHHAAKSPILTSSPASARLRTLALVATGSRAWCCQTCRPCCGLLRSCSCSPQRTSC